MRKITLWLVAAVAVGSMLIPVGPLGLDQAYARVPEPSSLLLFATGFASLARYLGKRK